MVNSAINILRKTLIAIAGLSLGSIWIVTVLIVCGLMWLPRCETEDSPNCFWDSGNSGNGQGQSFLDINGVAYYLRDTRTVTRD